VSQSTNLAICDESSQITKFPTHQRVSQIEMIIFFILSHGKPFIPINMVSHFTRNFIASDNFYLFNNKSGL